MSSMKIATGSSSAGASLVVAWPRICTLAVLWPLVAMKVAPGTRAGRSPKLPMWESLACSPLIAVTATGTLRSASSRRVAVTITS